ncbi:MAG: hypothetical protein AABX65_02695, partial [Nanoarchaeota archaeon]
KLALKIISIIKKDDPVILNKRYGLLEIEIEKEPWEILEIIGRKRGFLSKGGVVNEMKTALMIVHEWQKGKLRV